MIGKLAFRGLLRGKARFACAVTGIAVATGALVFSTSLVETNAAQAPQLAARACVPWTAWRVDGAAKGPKPDLRLRAVPLTVDYRPGGHVLQGPPMRVLLAEAPAENPYGAVRLAEGRWPREGTADREVVCLRHAMRRFGKASPDLGTEIKFVGRKGTMVARIVGYLDGGKLPKQFPSVLANRSAVAALSGETFGSVSFFRNLPADAADADSGFLTAASESVVGAFKGDEQRRMDYATPLLIVAAVLMAISLLVNSLLLSIESNRPVLTLLRTVGLTRGGVVSIVTVEAIVSAVAGWVIGAVGAMLSLSVYVAADPSAFPVGVAFDFKRLALSLAILPVVTFIAVLFALRPALKVRAMETATVRPRRRGMAITFACGFAAFVAVEVWGASLMRAFIPSPEWPDAIVSILPGGVSSFEIEKLRDVEGVRRISELLPLQLPLPKGGNALFLAAEWLPAFDYAEGDPLSVAESVLKGGEVVITRMMSVARNLHRGDDLTVRIGRGESAHEEKLRIAGVVDLNWHMVTSRGLLRGLNGMPGMTDGPVFASFDTVESLDPRPAPMVRMTHLWVEYEPAFLARHGVFPAGRLVEAEIARRLGNPVEATVRLHARDEIADGTLAHGSDVIGQAARVPFVFLAILAIGFVAMLVGEADARRRELVVLRTVGATKGQLMARLAMSAVKTAILGIVIGFPVGTLTGWLFTFGTASQWPGLPHYLVIPGWIVLEGGIGALIFALAFAIPASIILIERHYSR